MNDADPVDAVGVRPAQRVLDVRTGTGALAAAAASRGTVPIGIDLAEGMIASARASNPDIEFRLGDAEALPFPEAHLRRSVRAPCGEMTGGEIDEFDAPAGSERDHPKPPHARWA